MKNTSYKSLIGGLTLLIGASCSTVKHVSNQNISDLNSKNNTSLDYRMSLMIEESNKKFSSDSMNAMLIKTISGIEYTPKVNVLPEDVFVIGRDTIDCRLTSAGSAGPADSARLAHNAIVIRNASRIYPQSRPYLKYIIDACDNYRNDFDVPPEFMIGLLIAESNGNQYAISPVGARGGWQFMRATAEGMGMSWSMFNKYPKLSSLEKKIIRTVSNAYYYRNSAKDNLIANNFKLAEKYELTADSLFKEYDKANLEFEAEVKRIGSKLVEKSSQVFDIPISTNNAVKYIVSLAKRFKKEFHCHDEQALLWAAEAYNGGYGAVSMGIKKNTRIYPATRDYTRHIASVRAKIFPIYFK
jgi:hypothetical protein